MSTTQQSVPAGLAKDRERETDAPTEAHQIASPDSQDDLKHDQKGHGTAPAAPAAEVAGAPDAQEVKEGAEEASAKQAKEDAEEAGAKQAKDADAKDAPAEDKVKAKEKPKDNLVSTGTKKSRAKANKRLASDAENAGGEILAASAAIQNLNMSDPFAENEEEDPTPGEKQAEEYIHIRIQQRNGRKTLTTVQGVPDRFEMRTVLKHIKKKFACNGTLVSTDNQMGQVIQLQGDQRALMYGFLSDKKEGLGIEKRTIKVHGF